MWQSFIQLYLTLTSIKVIILSVLVLFKFYPALFSLIPLLTHLLRACLCCPPGDSLPPLESSEALWRTQSAGHVGVGPRRAPVHPPPSLTSHRHHPPLSHRWGRSHILAPSWLVKTWPHQIWPLGKSCAMWIYCKCFSILLYTHSLLEFPGGLFSLANEKKVMINDTNKGSRREQCALTWSVLALL